MTWFIAMKYRRNAKLALFTFILAFIVILLGAYTRLTDAGLSCPDWPHCYGFLTAPHTASQLQDAAQKYPLQPINIKKAWTEMTHRYFAGTEGILILFLSASILLSRKTKNIKSAMIGIALIGLLLTQVLLGMLTVTEKLKPIVVLAHLMTGLSILSVLWWAYLELPLHDDSFVVKSHSPPRFWLWLGFFILILQITLGGFVSTHYAGLACIDFPYCNGQLLPNMQWMHINDDLITIHMLHRMGALLTASYLFLLSLFLLKNPSFRVIALWMMAFLCLQISLGILNIVWLRPVWIALIHHTVAILLLLTLITALVKASLMGKHYASWFA